MDLEPGQPVFVKEVNGNIWRTATVDQPAAEPDSYWVRFPDNSILRRTRSMIKPRPSPSHFELQAEAQQRNFEGETNSHSFESFNQLNGQSMLPVTPMVSVIKPATIDRGSKVSEITDPISSTETPQPTKRGAISSLPSTPPRCSTRSTKGVPPVCYTPSKKLMDYSGRFMCASCAVESLGLLVLSLLYKRVCTCETWNYVECSSPLVYSKFLL